LLTYSSILVYGTQVGMRPKLLIILALEAPQM
jgi:hypothetical protein